MGAPRGGAFGAEESAHDSGGRFPVRTASVQSLKLTHCSRTAL